MSSVQNCAGICAFKLTCDGVFQDKRFVVLAGVNLDVDLDVSVQVLVLDTPRDVDRAAGLDNLVLFGLEDGIKVSGGLCSCRRGGAE